MELTQLKGEELFLVGGGAAVQVVYSQGFADELRIDPTLESICGHILKGTPVRENGGRFSEEEGRLYRKAPMGKDKAPCPAPWGGKVASTCLSFCWSPGDTENLQ